MSQYKDLMVIFTTCHQIFEIIKAMYSELICTDVGLSFFVPLGD